MRELTWQPAKAVNSGCVGIDETDPEQRKPLCAGPVPTGGRVDHPEQRSNTAMDLPGILIPRFF